MHVLCAGNDTVPISMRHSRGICTANALYSRQVQLLMLRFLHSIVRQMWLHLMNIFGVVCPSTLASTRVVVNSESCLIQAA